MQRCPNCREVKPLSEFHRDRARRLGRVSSCKRCSVAKSAAAYARRAVANRAYNERYRRKNLGKFAQKEANRRARKRQYWVENVDRDVLFERDGGICGICKRPVDSAEFDIDHVIPISRGGEHSYSNTQVAHPLCNGRKKNKLQSELAAPARYVPH
jgi:5-methylcytosine-specific restriction endonuclease McrA